jgi:hypothetical protein
MQAISRHPLGAATDLRANLHHVNDQNERFAYSNDATFVQKCLATAKRCTTQTGAAKQLGESLYDMETSLSGPGARARVGRARITDTLRALRER